MLGRGSTPVKVPRGWPRHGSLVHSNLGVRLGQLNISVRSIECADCTGSVLASPSGKARKNGRTGHHETKVRGDSG